MSIFNHVPSKTSHIFGQETAVKKIISFCDEFKKGKALFLYGPTGVGKTALVQAYASEQDCDLLELNASDTRSQKAIDSFLSKAIGQMSLFATKKIILIDEVDALSGRYDRGAAKAIAQAIEKSSFPIIITGVDPTEKKLKPLKKVVDLVEMPSLSSGDVFEGLHFLGKEYACSLDESLVKKIARHCGGDMRAATTDYFVACIEQTSELALEARKQTPDLSQALTRVFKTTKSDVSLGAYDDVEENLDTIFLWVDQNIPKQYTKAQDIDAAYETLAQADIFFGRIRRWQYYRFYVYCYLLLSVGIAISKDEKYPGQAKFSQPSRLLKYWQANMSYAKRKNIIEKLASHTKTSKKTALQDIYPFMLKTLATDKSVQDELDLDADEITWLKKQISS